MFRYGPVMLMKPEFYDSLAASSHLGKFVSDVTFGVLSYFNTIIGELLQTLHDKNIVICKTHLKLL